MFLAVSIQNGKLIDETGKGYDFGRMIVEYPF